MTNKYKPKKDYVDIKNISDLVPEELLLKINLLFNKDIPKTPETADEVLIWQLASGKETDIQQHSHKQFNLESCQLKTLNKFNELEFVQNDNGDGAAGNLTNGQRISLFNRKKREGSRKGFPDVSMYIFNQSLNLRDTVFCEFKKIGTPSAIHLTQEQLDWFLKLNSMGFNAYITNNPIFFRDVVMKDIRGFFKED